MLNGADEGSDCGVSPMASPSKELTATLQNDGRTQSSLQKGARATFWGLKHFQWYLTVLAILVLVAISLASSYIDGVGDNTRGILDVLDVKASTVSRVITGVKWVIAATWALAGTTMLGMNRPDSRQNTLVRSLCDYILLVIAADAHQKAIVTAPSLFAQ